MNSRFGKIIRCLLIAQICIFSSAFAGEVSQEKFKQVSLGMKKDEIVSVLGQPDSDQKEGMNEQGQTIERLEYSIEKSASTATQGYSMNQSSSGESRYGSHSAQQHQSNYICSLVIVNGALARIEKQPENPDNNASDDHPRKHGRHGASLNL